MSKLMLWQCKCGKTCGKFEASPVKGLCTVCFSKVEKERLKVERMKNLSKKRVSSKVAKMEKLTDFVEDL